MAINNSTKKKVIVVHDMFGTLFSLDAPTAALRASFPSLSPLRAHAIIMDWYQCVQRDLAMLTTIGAYQPASIIFKETLPRALKQAGISSSPSASTFTFDPKDESMYEAQHAQDAQLENPYPSSITQPILDSLQHLTPRPGFVEAFTDIYHSADNAAITTELWAATNGGTELARKLLVAGVGPDAEEYGGELKEEEDTGGKRNGVGIFSCDEVQASKPDPRVYAGLRQRLGLPAQASQDQVDATKDSAGAPSIWFVASHAWDLLAAKKAGFKTCWISYEEFYACPKLFGRPDIVALDLAEGARAILEWERSAP
ncbi:hypothetical protein OC842_001591 [Tilletia horrida]|uniref:Uncharacterized protein n=1 Tax=Tilletia horrida TaxID=155126 RepID=A0AAN6JM33_9BASI|nr:hypothetical protein OC842_001591 [Tilletia horrida]